jgi:hypothetical protein
MTGLGLVSIPLVSFLALVGHVITVLRVGPPRPLLAPTRAVQLLILLLSFAIICLAARSLPLVADQ